MDCLLGSFSVVTDPCNHANSSRLSQICTTTSRCTICNSLNLLLGGGGREVATTTDVLLIIANGINLTTTSVLSLKKVPALNEALETGPQFKIAVFEVHNDKDSISD